MSPTRVDLTVMETIHDAFRRDLDLLTRAAAGAGAMRCRQPGGISHGDERSAT